MTSVSYSIVLLFSLALVTLSAPIKSNSGGYASFPEDLCTSATQLQSIPPVPPSKTNQAQSQATVFEQSLYIGAVYPPLDATFVGGTTTIVFVQKKAESGAACDEKARGTAVRVLQELHAQKQMITPNMFTTQSLLFGNIAIYGKHTGSTTEKPITPYYQILKMDSHYLAEIPQSVLTALFASSEDSYAKHPYQYYWLQFSPPLPGAYQITINIDFAKCRGSLQDAQLSIDKRSHLETLVRHWHTSVAAGSESGIATASANGTLEYTYAQGDKYCQYVLLAPGVVKLRIDVQKSTDSQIVAAAETFRKATFCDLSSLSGTYWIYPAQYNPMPVARLLRDFSPMFNHPNCPSFYSILGNLKGQTTVCLNGDSNVQRLAELLQGKKRTQNTGKKNKSRREVDHGRGRHLLEVSPDLFVGSTLFDHDSHCLYVHNRRNKDKTKRNFNMPGYLDRFKFCMSEKFTPVVPQYLGHHLVELTAAELKDRLVVPLIKSINKHVANKLSSSSSPGSKNNKNNEHTRRIVFMATLASHVREFYSPKKHVTNSVSTNLMMFRSNSYREVLQMEALKEALLSTAGTGKRTQSSAPTQRVKLNANVNKDYVAYLGGREDLKGRYWTNLQKKAYTYIDTFHATLAMGPLLHSYHDPVHTHSWVYEFVAAALSVNAYCRENLDVDVDVGTGTGSGTGNSTCFSMKWQRDAVDNHAFNYLEWNPVRTVEWVHAVQRNVDYDFEADAAQLVPSS